MSIKTLRCEQHFESWKDFYRKKSTFIVKPRKGQRHQYYVITKDIRVRIVILAMPTTRIHSYKKTHQE